jgi:hypothetical protein
LTQLLTKRFALLGQRKQSGVATKFDLVQ